MSLSYAVFNKGAINPLYKAKYADASECFCSIVDNSCHRASAKDARIGWEDCVYLLFLLNIIIRVTAWNSEFYVNCV